MTKMVQKNWLKWVGVVVSVLAAVCFGIVASFNVYAVKLKTSFHLDQSQVEVVAACVVMGWSFQIVTAWVIKRFGYQPCYILVLLLTSSSSLLMWVATHYVTFFRENIWLMCIFQYINSAGATGGIQCVAAIAAEHFSTKHSGKVIGVYMAALGFGNCYYSALFEIFFERQESMRSFFLTLAISLGGVVVLCLLLHRPPEPEDVDEISHKSRLLQNSVSDESVQNAETNTKDKRQNDCHTVEKSQIRTLLSSSYFYLLGGCYILFLTITCLFINNVTNIGTAVGTKNPFRLVYILSIVIVTSRIIIGTLYDYFGTPLSGFILLLVQYVLFICSMLICLFWLEGWRVYVMVVLASVGCGAGWSLPLSMLMSKFGVQSYPIISGVVEVVCAPLFLIAHFAAGWTYDKAKDFSKTTDLFCKECFNGTYLIMLSFTIAVLLLQIVNVMLHYVRLRHQNGLASIH